MSSTDTPSSFDERLSQREAVISQPHPLDTKPTDANSQPHGNIPNTPLAVSFISFLLGICFTLGMVAFSAGYIHYYWWSTYQLGFFAAAWAAFHYGEFAVTAGWNKGKCSVDSFLLDNGVLYHISNGVALLEYLVTLYFKPSLKAFPHVSTFGIAMTIFGQCLRSIAMIHASTNFSHMVAFHKANDHQLVTSGVYSWFRHPSYAGFFYWGLGTQLVLQNSLSFLLYAVLLWRFFYNRIRFEETALVKFFGDDYVKYRNRVGTMIPFIP
ncbi:protein-s-isoprenylcysteine O-methyltransferase [Rickenella mellea]|uniref:Protein-S-isoprenylcysteine O-methyltransferase n=1 Tax=Rickenella mellea TaxID=50990 RepID=A0A4R5XFU3_9AGAM|nr:protein-s-isoprenylcysteine O-methyltransferase [Rickenella mellea]